MSLKANSTEQHNKTRTDTVVTQCQAWRGLVS